METGYELDKMVVPKICPSLKGDSKKLVKSSFSTFSIFSGEVGVDSILEQVSLMSTAYPQYRQFLLRAGREAGGRDCRNGLYKKHR
jgi:hypothetical protein